MQLLHRRVALIVLTAGQLCLGTNLTIGSAQVPATAKPYPDVARLERPLRVMTANIWNYQEPYAARMTLLREQIEELSPDLIGFQEAGWKPGEDHQVQQLLQGLGYHIHHERDGAEPTERQLLEVAVASRWSTSAVALWKLPGSGKALAVQVAAPEPIGPVLFVSTFGTARWQLDRELNREKDAVALDRHIRERANPADFPPIIAGDFDATPDAASMRFLTGLQSLAGASTHYRDAWAWAGDPHDPGYTWTTRNAYVAKIAQDAFQARDHHRRIDYILVGSPTRYRRFAQIVSCRVVLDIPREQEPAALWPSDHFGILAEISAER